MVYVLFGAEDFLLYEELEGIKASLGPDDPDDMVGLNITRLAGQSLSLPELQAVCDTVPFLASSRLVIVEGLLKRFEPRRPARPRPGAAPRGPDAEQETSTQETGASPSRRGQSTRELEGGWEALGDYARRMPETTHLVLVDLVEEALSRSNPLLTLLKPVAQVREFRKLREPALEQWVRERASRLGIRVAPAALNLLVQVVGDNLRVLNSELEKLSLYAGDEPVQPQHVHDLVASARESTIFSLIDAVAEGKLPRAQYALHQLLKDGWAEPQILFRLSQQFRLLLLAKVLGQQKVAGQALMQRLGIRSEYPFKKTVSQARRYSVPSLENVLRRLLDTDVAVKTGKLHPEVALELLVTDLCRGALA